MTVDIAQAAAAGLTVEAAGPRYAFRGRGCKLEFEDEPERYLDPKSTPSM